MMDADKRRFFRKKQGLNIFYRRPSAFIIAKRLIFEFYFLKRRVP